MWLYNKYFRIITFFKIIWYKVLFRKNLKIGKKLRFRKRFNIIIKGNAKLIIGDNVFFNNDVSLNCLQRIEIGNDTIIGENVKFYDHNHKFNEKNILIGKQGYKTGNIKIGNNVWIGSNVCILKGVTIGNNCVIGAGCVIKNNIKENSIVQCKKTYSIKNIIYKEKDDEQ